MAHFYTMAVMWVGPQGNDVIASVRGVTEETDTFVVYENTLRKAIAKLARLTGVTPDPGDVAVTNFGVFPAHL